MIVLAAFALIGLAAAAGLPRATTDSIAPHAPPSPLQRG
jgi:hypothetical protein